MEKTTSFWVSRVSGDWVLRFRPRPIFIGFLGLSEVFDSVWVILKCVVLCLCCVRFCRSKVRAGNNTTSFGS